MKKTLVGLLAGALMLSAFSCDSFSSNKTSDQDPSRGRGHPGPESHNVYFRINPKDPSLSEFIVEEKGETLIISLHEDHNDTYWHLSAYCHSVAEDYWNVFKNYGLKALGSKASIEYWEDKHPWYEYDHYHWYLVVDGVKIAEYEKVGGAASAAYDHVRLLKSWWDYRRR